MIVCKQCGYQNEEGDTFCGSCGAFLEWVGEKVGPEPEPVPEPVTVPADPSAEEKAGLITRIKHAITGDEALGAGETPAGPAGDAAAPDPVSAGPAPATTAPAGGGIAPTAVTATVVDAEHAASSLAPPVGAGAPAGGSTSAPLPPPPSAGHGSLPPPPAGSAFDTEAAKKREEEARRRAAEDDEHRREEEARRKAALLVAKPKESVADTKPSTGVTPTTTPKGKKAEPAATAAAAAAATGIETRQPGAQQPGAPVSRPKVQKQAPTRVVKPGDLVCGECGESNDSTRKFCRRCGASLAEVVPVKKPGFFKRLFTRKPKEAAPAGSRPGRGGEGGGGKGRRGAKARLAKGKVQGSYDKLRGAVALLAVLGVGAAIAIPSGRSLVMKPVNSVTDWFHRLTGPLKDALPNQDATKFTSQMPEFPAKFAVDNITNNHWLPLPNDPGPAVAAVWDDPVTLRKLRVFSGDQDQPQNFAANPRPKDLFITVFDDQGHTRGTKQVRLDDSPKQTIDFKFSNVSSVRVEIQDCYNALPAAPKQCGITELNFLK
jgi:hypothetical protein